MALVQHPRSLGYAAELFVFSAVPTLITIRMVSRDTLDQFAAREHRVRIGAAFFGASYAFLMAALGS